MSFRSTYFNFFLGWPKFRPGFFTKHTSYHPVWHFIKVGRIFAQLWPFFYLVLLVLPLNTSGRNFCQLAIDMGYDYYNLQSYNPRYLYEK